MVKKQVKKLWRGCISIRDGWVNSAINDGGLEVTFNNETMSFSPEYLKSIEYTKTVQSKFGDHTYQLADIRWNPEQKNQDKLF